MLQMVWRRRPRSQKVRYNRIKLILNDRPIGNGVITAHSPQGEAETEIEVGLSRAATPPTAGGKPRKG